MAPARAPKRGRGGGKTKRGKGSRLMAWANRAGLSSAVGAASPHEVPFVEAPLVERFLAERSRRLMRACAYASAPLAERLAAKGLELIAPPRRKRRRPAPQAGRALRQLRRR